MSVASGTRKASVHSASRTTHTHTHTHPAHNYLTSDLSKHGKPLHTIRTVFAIHIRATWLYATRASSV